jgi:hypothetical protein
VPVLAKVDEILRAMCPDLPMPDTMTRPRDARIRSTAAAKSGGTASAIASTAAPSVRSTRRAVASGEAARVTGNAPSTTGSAGMAGMGESVFCITNLMAASSAGAGPRRRDCAAH